MQVLNEYLGWNHVFCLYQGSRVYRRIIVEAKRRGCNIAICCEAPCNMMAGAKKLLKWFYIRFALPIIVKDVIASADFFINCSGNNNNDALKIGWPAERIVPFGYYPPPIIGSRCIKRTSNQPFSILATGILTEYRGADVLVEALRILKNRGVEYSATITQEGPLLSGLKAKAREYRLPIAFPGMVPMQELIGMYETCSVYVGAGRSEPWGMRLNDALNCGAPLVVSRGMGGVRMVDDHGCGISFSTGDAKGLADVLQRLATDEGLYSQASEKTLLAAKKNTPESKAREFLSILDSFWGINNAKCEIGSFFNGM